MQFVYGILGLGLVVLIHEAGHFFAARAMGIDVEVFSIGWGKKLVGFTRGKTEYRISWIPIGGFIKMKGETEYQRALEHNLTEIEAEPGSLFAAAPWRRIVVSLAGPAMNLIFAILVLALIHLIGYNYNSPSNQIVVAADYRDLLGENPVTQPAVDAGLKTGDRITSVDGVKTDNFNTLYQQLSLRVLEDVKLNVERGDEGLQLSARLPTDSGEAAPLGVLPFRPPVVGSPIDPSTSLLKSGDVITAINGATISNGYDITRVLRSIPVAAGQTFAEVDILRDGQAISLHMPLNYNADNQIFQIGFYYKDPSYRVQSAGPIAALGDGWTETWGILTSTVDAIGKMFHGLNFFDSTAGPGEFTYLLGDATMKALKEGFWEGVQTFFSILSFLSVALFFGNLLPIPVLDGGQILIYLIEMVRGKPIKPKALFRYQTIGALIVFALIAVILFGDFLFFFPNS